jgi:hypothetical protein
VPSSTVAAEMASVYQLLSLGAPSLSFVISTEAQRSGEICGSMVLSWRCLSCRAKLEFIRRYSHKLFSPGVPLFLPAPGFSAA